MANKFKHPLMKNNILRSDLDELINFLEQDDPILTQSTNVKAFEATVTGVPPPDGVKVIEPVGTAV